MTEEYDFIELNDIDSANYTFDFPPNDPLVLGDNATVGLKDIFIWYTWPNISEKYDNNKIKIFHNNAWKTYEIRQGMYEIEHLSDCINRLIADKDVLDMDEPEPEKIIDFSVDRSTLHCILRMRAGVKIDFTSGKLHELLGFEPRIYDSNARGKNNINITRGVDKIFIRCDLVSRKHQYKYRDVLYTLSPMALAGEAIMERVEPIEFYPCRNRFIRSITVSVTDKDGKQLLLSEPFNVKLIFKSNNVH